MQAAVNEGRVQCAPRPIHPQAMRCIARRRSAHDPHCLDRSAAHERLIAGSTWAGQAPGAAAGPDFPLPHRDRVYAAGQFSNTLSITDTASNKLLGSLGWANPSRPTSARYTPARVIVQGSATKPGNPVQVQAD